MLVAAEQPPAQGRCWSAAGGGSKQPRALPELDDLGGEAGVAGLDNFALRLELGDALARRQFSRRAASDRCFQVPATLLQLGDLLGKCGRDIDEGCHRLICPPPLRRCCVVVFADSWLLQRGHRGPTDVGNDEVSQIKLNI